MSTVSTTRAVRKVARPKPQRFVNLLLPPFEDNPGVIRLTVGKVIAEYLLRVLSADFGPAFELVKADGEETYHVNLNAQRPSCECQGFLRWGHCKHVDGLKALVKHGSLSTPPALPVSTILDRYAYLSDIDAI